MNLVRAIILIFLVFNLSLATQLVPMSKKDIKYKTKINPSHIYYVAESNKFKCKEYLNPNILKQNLYVAKRYIIKNSPICGKDVLYKKRNVVRFKFGNLYIEREGEVLRETDEYIRIKNSDGKIEKIYKDGKTR